MNRTFLFILFLLSTYACFSPNTTVSGHLSGVAEGQYIYLTSYPMGKDAPYLDSAKIKKGMFSLQLSIPDGEGGLYYISSVSMQLDQEREPVDPVKYTHRWKLIYLQQGRVVVNGDGNHLDSAAYSGDEYMREENDYFVQQRSNTPWEKFIDSRDEAYARGENMSGSRPLREDSADKSMMLGMYVRIQTAENWVKSHPNSPYSAVVVYKDVSKFFDERAEEKTRYFHLLTPAAKKNKIGKFLANWLH